MQPIKFTAEVEVTNRRPSSDSELISRIEMTLFACVTTGPSREPCQTIRTVYFILGIFRTDLCRRGSRITQRAPKAQAFIGVRRHAPREFFFQIFVLFLRFLSHSDRILARF